MEAYIGIIIRTFSAILLRDFVTGITIGTIAANLAFTHLLLSLFVITVTSIVLSIIALKSRKMRRLISGSPTILIEGGKFWKII
ncbi:hypothetical protein [Paenibacillus sp. URB8-2]|uniref:hypothetical protein n=1 Tax=Paenibacillus sp. URB8-2 TaxID=2741301 RepID=UPI0015C251E2|nr:hypothetical protein [Paenibacillus sp. URB8-2]BCG61617.1 hypothetical protein PUR_50420 [Paenibacillus sp. URB8-2]